MAVHIGEIIKKEMERQHMSEEVFADRINTSRSNVYNIYTRPNFNTEQLRDISKALNINLFNLISKEMEGEMVEGAGEGEFLESVGKLRRDLEKENPGMRIIGGNDTAREREDIKKVLEEYFKKPHVKPLLIIEVGYTFCAVEVVRQVAQDFFGDKGYAVCPKAMNNVVALRSVPQPVLSDYIDKNGYGSEEAIENRLSEIYRAQQDTKKHFVCILHVESQNEIYEALDLWKDQFFVAEYEWNRNSLLSWAIDTKQHPQLIDYIQYHKMEYGKEPDLGVDAHYPTNKAYSQQDFEYVSECLEKNMDINPLRDYYRPMRFAKEVANFDKNKKDTGYKPISLKRTVGIGLTINGNDIDLGIQLPYDDVATLVYIYDQAVKGPLKGLDEDALDEQFFPWLQKNHPILANVIVDATEETLAERMTIGGPEETDYYREIIYHYEPCSMDDWWSLADGNEIKYYLGGFPDRV
jgi:hypothetical protein